MSIVAAPPIRVLIADDSAVMRAALSRVIESAPSLEVCGTARHGLEALEKIRELRPDVVTLDVEMPVLNGLEVLKRIMREFPRPVIMVSSLTQEGAEVTLEALGVGAFDYLPKSDSGKPIDPHKLKRELIEKIEAAAHSPLARRCAPATVATPANTSAALHQDFHILPEIIAIGTSTGSPKALQEILPELPADLPTRHCHRAAHASWFHRSVCQAARYHLQDEGLRGQARGHDPGGGSIHSSRRSPHDDCSKARFQSEYSSL
jgi:two-component system chemotaxis response regulator CheB